MKVVRNVVDSICEKGRGQIIRIVQRTVRFCRVRGGVQFVSPQTPCRLTAGPTEGLRILAVWGGVRGSILPLGECRGVPHHGVQHEDE